MQDFVLFSVGEESGDVLGEQAVLAARAVGFSVRGTGGIRMQQAGLEPLENFENLAVSGFSDVFSSVLFLFRHFQKMKRELERPECKALFAIDYPGLNLRLVRFTEKLNKKVFYLAPPQIFAWKKNRARFLTQAKLGVFFSFEAEAYQKAKVDAEILQHPFLQAAKEFSNLKQTSNLKQLDFSKRKLNENKKNVVMLMPGSRPGVLRRNLKTFLWVEDFLKEQTSFQVIWLLPNQNLADFVLKKTALRNNHAIGKIGVSETSNLKGFENLKDIENSKKHLICVMPSSALERFRALSRAKLVIANPGTAVFESACVGVPYIALVKPDALSYLAGKFFLKIQNLTIPNLMLDKRAFPEIVVSPFFKNLSKKMSESLKNTLRQILSQSSKQSSKERIENCESAEFENLTEQALCDFQNKISKQNNRSRTIYSAALEFFSQLI